MFYNENKTTIININEYIKGFLLLQGKTKKSLSLNFANLSNVGIDCKTSIFSTPLVWCIESYLNKSETILLNQLNNNCPPEDYYSGFYIDNSPIFDIGILRHPYDLEESHNSLTSNKFTNQLDKSIYKKEIINAINLDHAIEFNNIFKDPLINIISYFNKETNKIFMTLNKLLKESYKDVITDDEMKKNFYHYFTILVCKSLNYIGYNIPIEYINTSSLEFFIDDKFALKFNELVKLLSTNDKWILYTIDILMQKNMEHWIIIDQQIQSNKSFIQNNEIDKMLNDVEADQKLLKIEMYEKKYYKYKQKYIKLLKQKN
jgi:hypothetical protein